MPRKKMKVIEVRGTAQESPPVQWRWKAREVGAVVLILLSAYALISLVTFRSSDVPSVYWDPTRHGFASNKGGTLGASLGGFLFRYLGMSAYGLVFFATFWGAMILLRREIRDALAKFAGVLLFLVASSTFLSLVTPAGFAQSELYRDTTLPSLGGAYGDHCRDLLIFYVGSFGTFLAVLLVLSVSMVLATDWMIYFGLLRAWRLVRIAGLGCLLVGRRCQAALTALPPLLQAAGHSARVRMPAPTMAAEPPEVAGEAPRKRGGRAWNAMRDLFTGVGTATAAAPAAPPVEVAIPPAAEEREELEAVEETPIPAPVEAESEEEADWAPAATPIVEEDPSADEPATAIAPEPDPEIIESAPPAEDAEIELPTESAGSGNDETPAAAPEPQPGPAIPPPPPTINLGLHSAPTARVPAPERPPRKEPTKFKLPPLSLLEDPVPTPLPTLERDIELRIKGIENALQSFGITARVVHVDRGPSITIYELELAAGIRVNKIIGMSDDLAIALKAPNVRIVAPIPGKSSIGIEVPNSIKEAVRVKELLTAQDQPWKNFALPLFLGKDVSGMHVVKNLEEMPHLLVAGTTGSGKSVCLNTIILSLLLTKTPEEMKMILIDPKMVEMTAFKDMPHLLSPVVTDMKRAPVVLDWVIRQMDERYDLMARAGVKKLSTFNSLGERKLRERLGAEPDDEIPTQLPRIVVVIDELADLMMVAPKEVENSITRLAQKSRAVGIHLVLATQRPSVDVITGLIKANMPARIAFKVASGIDSRTILDQNGAERMLGKGDMLISVPGSMELLRAQCTYVDDSEISGVVEYLKEQGTPTYDTDLVEVAEGEQLPSGDHDELYAEAVRIVVENQRGSVSLLQRKLEIGYSRAARLVDFMANDGIVGNFKGSKAREVIMSIEQYQARFVTGPAK